MVREILPQINTFVGCGDTRAINVIDINPKISASASVSKKKQYLLEIIRESFQMDYT